MAVLIDAPWLAFVLAALCGGLYLASRLTVVGVAAGAWALYGIYECLMYSRVLCSGECNIRIDLLLIYPGLALLTAVSVIRLSLSWRSRNNSA